MMCIPQAMAALDPNAAQATMASLAQGGAGVVPSPAAESAVAANLIRAIPPTRVLVMLNMVTEAELTDPQEYEVGIFSALSKQINHFFGISCRNAYLFLCERAFFLANCSALGR